jgi:hypothetical protein
MRTEWNTATVVKYYKKWLRINNIHDIVCMYTEHTLRILHVTTIYYSDDVHVFILSISEVILVKYFNIG